MFFKTMGIGLAAGFCRRMGTGFRAGLDLATLCRQEAKFGTSRHRELMSSVAEGVRSGNPLARAMLDSDKYFPPMMVQMVHIGETTGRLERTLLELADHYDHRVEMRRTFMRGIAWPMLQLMGGLMVVGLFLLIVEALNLTFNPIGISFGQYIVMVILGAIVAVGAVVALKINAFGIHRVFSLVYQVPKIGESLQTIALSRVCWTLSLALDSGMDALRSVKMALQSTQNDYFASRSDTAVEKIKGGGTLAEAFESTGVFPDEFLHFVGVAEESGTDAESLGNLANIYDERAKMAIRILVGVLTGLIWLSVAGLLIFIILKMAMGLQGLYADPFNNMPEMNR